MSKRKTDTPQTSVRWPVWIMIGFNLPLVLFLIELVNALFFSESQGVVDVTAERTAFFIGLYLTIPSGVISLFVGIRALLKGSTGKPITVIGSFFGAVSIIVGIVSWVWFMYNEAFVSAFSR